MAMRMEREPGEISLRFAARRMPSATASFQGRPASIWATRPEISVLKSAVSRSEMAAKIACLLGKYL